MKNLAKIFLLLWVSSYGLATVGAQDLPSFRKKAEDVIKAKNPVWKLIRKQERQKEITTLWGRDDKADVVITIFYGASEQEASNRMQATMNRLSGDPGRKRTGLGDEAYSSKTEPRGSGVVRFRKANVYVSISASSFADAEDLAKKLAALIKKNPQDSASHFQSVFRVTSSRDKHFHLS